MTKTETKTARTELLKKYTYNKDTGIFTTRSSGVYWREPNEHGYITLSVKLNGKAKGFLAHRAAWLIETGELPEVVDHINGDRKDNRISNLRAATVQQNVANRSHKPKSSSGYFGVTKKRKKWEAKIKHKGKDKYLGVYDTPEDAAKAYDIAAISMNGEFATINGVDTKGFKPMKEPQHEHYYTDELVCKIKDTFSLCENGSGAIIRNKGRGVGKNICENKMGKVRTGDATVTVAQVRHILTHGKPKPRRKPAERKYNLKNPSERMEFVCSLLGVYDYNKDTGVFSRGGVDVTTTTRQGYIFLQHKRKTVPAHRMAYLIVYGELPEVVDHINGVRNDNRIKNLRAATRQQNAANSRHSRGASKYKGVSTFYGRWLAGVAGKYIGIYNSQEEAALAYDEAAVKMYGEYALTNQQQHA